MSDADRFLDAVAARLVVPDAVRGEILEELQAHLDDSVERLIEAGRTRDEATTEAIDRLGPPDALARDLAAAHRRPRQLLAAAGAGTWAAVRTGVLATIAAWLVVGVLSLVAAMLARAVIGWFGEPSLPGAWGAGSNTVITAAGLAIGGFFAANAAARAVARCGWWTDRQARAGVGGVGALAGGIVLLGLVEQALNWASVAAMLLVPVAIALGAALSNVRLPLRPAAAAFVLSLVLPAVFVSVATTTGGGAMNYDWNEATHGYEMIAPWWEDPSNGPATAFTSGESWSTMTGVEQVTVFASSQEVVDQFRDFRVEAWRAEPPGNGWRLLAGQTGPFAEAPATVEGTAIAGTLRFNRSPQVDWAQVVVTAIGPDGRRYLLSASGPTATVFRGSVLDWFLALAQ